MSQRAAVLLLLVFSLQCVVAFSEQGNSDPEGRIVSLASENSVIQYVILRECTFFCESFVDPGCKS